MRLEKPENQAAFGRLFIYWNKWFVSGGYIFVCLCVCAVLQRESVRLNRAERAHSLCAFRVQISLLIQNHFKLINDNKGEGQQRSEWSAPLSLLLHFTTTERRGRRVGK